MDIIPGGYHRANVYPDLPTGRMDAIENQRLGTRKPVGKIPVDSVMVLKFPLRAWWLCGLFTLVSLQNGRTEPIRVTVSGAVTVSLNNPEGTNIPLSYIDSILIFLDREIRLFKGIELEFTVPQAYLFYRGSLALGIYGELSGIPETGMADLQARQLSFEPIPHKIQTVYQIPLRQGHGLKTTPYVSVPTTIIPAASFPLLFRVMPVIKGLSEDVEEMRFTLHVKPILSDEGGVKIIPRFPKNLQDRPFTVLIDDQVVEKPSEIQFLKEGEHHLVILSNDYRNENRLFLIDRGKILELPITLQDPTPMVFFEAPEHARIYFDAAPVNPAAGPIPAEPGNHEIKFQLSDYTVIKRLTILKGKTYRVAMSLDVEILESD